MAKVDDLFQSARTLSRRKRAQLAHLLPTSLGPPDLQPDLDDAAWATEMRRRAEAAARADWKGVPWKSALGQISRGLKRRRR